MGNKKRPEPIKKLNRFTTLPILLDLLQRKKLTLLDPKPCDDKNDSEVILEYNDEKYFEINIPLDIINRITISQQMPEPIYATIKNYLKDLKGNPESRISRSILYENKRWINRFKKN